MMATKFLAKNVHLSCSRTVFKLRPLRHIVRYSTISDKLKTVANGPGLKEFLIAGKNLPAIEPEDNSVPYLSTNQYDGNGRKVFFEIYGCQMNSNDGEVVNSVLKSSNYVNVDRIDQADVVLLVTCSVRDNAEAKVSRIGVLKSKKWSANSSIF